MPKIETVEIDRDGTKVIINASDFDDGRDKLWGKKAKPAPVQPETEVDGLAEEYEAIYGKKPHHKMKPESIRQAINSKTEDE